MRSKYVFRGVSDDGTHYPRLTPPYVVLTATANPAATREFWSSWLSAEPINIWMIGNGPKAAGDAAWKAISEVDKRGQVTYVTLTEILGVVPAFALGLDQLSRILHPETIVYVLHDDVELIDPLSVIHDKWIKELFWAKSRGLAGFCGALGLGREDLRDPEQHKPENYSPYHLVRRDVRSNMRDAEAHGVRSERVERCAVFDGFSQIGRLRDLQRWFTQIKNWGVVHHAYDAALGALAFNAGKEAWYVPARVHHAGGRTAVGNTEYQDWAKTKIQGGDQGFWVDSHRLVWEKVNQWLPITVRDGELVEGGVGKGLGGQHRG